MDHCTGTYIQTNCINAPSGKVVYFLHIFWLPPIKTIVVRIFRVLYSISKLQGLDLTSW